MKAFIAPLCALSVAACGGGTVTVQSTGPLASGQIETWAGTGIQGDNGDGSSRLETWLDQPMEVAFAGDGTALVADWNNHCVRRVTTAGVFENVIGTPMPGDWPCDDPSRPDRCEVPLSGEVPSSSLSLNHPMDVVPKDDGSFFLAAWHNHKIESYEASSKSVTIVAGLQKPGPAVAPPPMMGTTPPPGLPPGDGGPAAKAPLNFPSSLALQADGGLLVSDERNDRIRRIAPDDARTITTVAGAAATTGQDGDGISATTALLSLTTTEQADGADNPPPGGAIALDGDGNLYVGDTFHHCVRRVAAGQDGIVGVGDPSEETISTVAGTCGQRGYTGDGGAATKATLYRPFDVEIGPDAALYVADTMNHVIRRVDLAKGTIETVAGTGKPGFSGDGGPAILARLREPYGIAFDDAGDLYVVDTVNNRIRRIAR